MLFPSLTTCLAPNAERQSDGPTRSCMSAIRSGVPSIASSSAVLSSSSLTRSSSRFSPRHEGGSKCGTRRSAAGAASRRPTDAGSIRAPASGARPLCNELRRDCSRRRRVASRRRHAAGERGLPGSARPGSTRPWPSRTRLRVGHATGARARRHSGLRMRSGARRPPSTCGGCHNPRRRLQGRRRGRHGAPSAKIST